MNPATSVLDVGRDLGRAFRERPALIVGGGVLILIGVNVLNRRPEEAPPATDPLGELFPGVSSAGGSGIPGSGSVPFGGYPSAGDGAFTPPPEIAPLPGWGLTCNGEPKPSIAGLPGTWECTDAGWKYVAPASSPTTPPATGSQWWPARLGPPPANAVGYVSVNGRVAFFNGSGTTRSYATANFSAYVAARRTITFAGQRVNVYPIVSGSHAGRLLGLNSAVTFRPKT